MQHTNASKTARLPSLIDTIGQGFGAVNRRLWVLIIPLVLDLLYWLGPRLSFQPLIERLGALLRAMDPNAWQQLEQQVGPLLAPGSSPIDLTLPGLPSMINLLAPRLAHLPPPPTQPPVWYVGSVGVLVGAVALLGLAALLATTIYLVALAGALRGREQPPLTLRRWGQILGSTLTIGLMLLGVLLLVTLPLSIVASLAQLASPLLASLMLLMGLALLFWLLFTASFAFDAVVMSDVGPLRALLTSLLLVQRCFWGAAGLLVLGWLILAGLSLIWQQVAISTTGMLLAMLGSAYISSGLAAAHLVFYRDRLRSVSDRMSRLARRA
ncbi:hypothetical protein [Kallotenue papyrolyticum]|uniref:hypothetical protein n=1 Tax=Kallotenue papyrolyticum TaxID=1325125 RepID=UPI00047860FC|nr:hypothetical protein [Kallotenue papyrolyticum]